MKKLTLTLAMTLIMVFTIKAQNNPSKVTATGPVVTAESTTVPQDNISATVKSDDKKAACDKSTEGKKDCCKDGKKSKKSKKGKNADTKKCDSKSTSASDNKACCNSKSTASVNKEATPKACSGEKTEVKACCKSAQH
jgi:hypothetical protein